MKRGEAGGIGRQPRVGTVRTDASGQRWVKQRALSRFEWGEALCAAHLAMRFGGLNNEHLRAMGYAKETP